MLNRIKAAISGFTYSWKFFQSAEVDNRLPYWPEKYEDISKSLVYDYKTIVSASRKLYANCGIAKAVEDKAMYAVGRAWLPRFNGSDKEWGKAAAEWLVEKYYPINDVRGSVYDFRTNLYLDSINVDVSGDYGVLLTQSDSGWPQTQRVPSHRINSGDSQESEPLESGPYKNLIIQNGIIYNPFGRPVAYRIETETGYQDVSARDFIHVFDPAWYDQGRGIPAYNHALNDLRSLQATQGFEQLALQLCSSIGLVEENEIGGPDPRDPSVRLRVAQPSTTQNGITTKSFFGGMYKYFKAGSGSKLSTLEHGRPGANWESFWNRVIKNACVGTGWPYELLWAINTIGGAPLRAVLAKAGRCVEDRQDLLRPVARREIQYAIAKAIKINELPASDEWFKWDFTLPAFITADAGREAQQDREDYKARIATLEDILAPQGRTPEQHYRQLAHEYKLKNDIAAEEGVPAESLGIPPALLGQNNNKPQK